MTEPRGTWMVVEDLNYRFWDGQWLKKASSSWMQWLKVVQEGLHHLDELRPPHLTSSLLGPDRPYPGPRLPHTPLAKEQPRENALHETEWAGRRHLEQRLVQAERRAEEAEARERLIQEKLRSVTHMCQRLQAIVHSPRTPVSDKTKAGGLQRQLSRGLLSPPFRGSPRPYYLDLTRPDTCSQTQTLL